LRIFFVLVVELRIFR